MMTNKELITEKAVEVFGSEEKAHEWLVAYHKLLDAKPIDYSNSQEGFLIVMQILNSIKYGGVV
jgi:uncharacterized protein (DUF2384 family)